MAGSGLKPNQPWHTTVVLSPIEREMRLDSRGRSYANQIFNKPNPSARRPFLSSDRTRPQPPERSCLVKQKGQHTAIFATANVLHRGAGIAEDARKVSMAQGVLFQGRKR